VIFYTLVALQTLNSCKSAKNIFFALVGALPDLDKMKADRLRSMSKMQAIAKVSDSAKVDHWIFESIYK